MATEYLFQFATEEDAIADPVVGKYWIPADDCGDPATWRGSCTITPYGSLMVFKSNDPAPPTIDNDHWYIVIADDTNSDLAAHAYILPEGWQYQPHFWGDT